MTKVNAHPLTFFRLNANKRIIVRENESKECILEIKSSNRFLFNNYSPTTSLERRNRFDIIIASGKCEIKDKNDKLMNIW